jgi:hypothetical protein
LTERELLDALVSAANIQQLEAALALYLSEHPTAAFAPVGRRPNNRGAIEVATDPGRSLIERVTNAHDAILELEHTQHGGNPVCRSPREAASAWLGVPQKDGLSALTNKERQDLATRTVVRLEPGEGTQSRLVSVTDRGIGIAPDKLEGTILSLNESNKIQKHYLAGTYGQGGSSTFAFCKYAFIASRLHGTNAFGFTVVKYEDLPAEEFKTGRYVFLVNGDAPLHATAVQGDLPYGTVVRHFGYDLTRYTSALGSKSLYGILGRILFDPVSAIRFENQVLGWNRTIKGARNALNGAVDEGDDDSKGPSLDHHVPMFNISLGDYGSIGIEYWVLARPEARKGRKRTKPSENFVDSTKPIVLTHNGQNQGEITGRTIKDDADLPYLQTQGRLICHVNCDRLSPTAKRLLFSSTREQSREGFMQELIRNELVGALRADDELVRLNEEARDESLKEKDEDAQRQMRQQVARLLRIAGAALQEVGGNKGDKDGKEVRPRPPRPKPLPIAPSEPPTYVKIVWDQDKDVPFYAGQRRYVRVETDANSDYHDADDPTNSRLNIAVGGDLKVFGTSPLKGGRMRIGVECADSVVVGSSGSIRVELYRKGLSALGDERQYGIVEPPEPKEGERRSNLPDFEVIPVEGPEDEDWEYICDDAEDTDVSRHASNFTMTQGKLYVYYSEAFPRFATELRRHEQQNEALAASFRTRYETWLAVHSLLMYQETQSAEAVELPEGVSDEMKRQERSRLAVIAAMVAAQEVKSGMSPGEEDESSVA